MLYSLMVGLLYNTQGKRNGSEAIDNVITLVDATNTSNVENAIKDNTKVRERGEDGRERRGRKVGGRREREEERQVYIYVNHDT